MGLHKEYKCKLINLPQVSCQSLSYYRLGLCEHCSFVLVARRPQSLWSHHTWQVAITTDLLSIPVLAQTKRGGIFIIKGQLAKLIRSDVELDMDHDPCLLS